MVNISYFLRQVRKADRDLSAENQRKKKAAIAAHEFFTEIENNEIEFTFESKLVKFRSFREGSEFRIWINDESVFYIYNHGHDYSVSGEFGEEILEYFAETEEELQQA